MSSNIKKLLNDTKREVSLWAYAAWTLPFVALTIVLIQDFFNLQTSLGITIGIIIVTFIAVSVFWWWWALRKIFLITVAMKHNEEGFEQVISELRKTRSVVREHLNDKNLN